MNEYTCGTCGWSAKASHPLGIVAASEHHAKQGCEPTNQAISDDGHDGWCGCERCEPNQSDGDS